MKTEKTKRSRGEHRSLGAPELLASCGLKKTPFRLALLSLLIEAGRPLTSAQIYSALNKKNRRNFSFDRATVFRNLKSLSKNGVLQTAEFGTGATYFCVETHAHHHHHLFCTKCKTAAPINGCGIGPMIAQAKEAGFSVQSHRLELLGLCQACQ